MKVAIHQADFYPWLGVFHKAANVEEFIFFDHVFAPQGKHWTTRNKILVNGEARWLTIPVKKRGKSSQRYNEIEISYGENFERKHLGILKMAYGKCEYFDEVFPMVEAIYGERYQKLLDFNKRLIRNVSSALDLNVSFSSSYEMIEKDPELMSLSGNELVLQLCLAANATEYLSGEGCLDFIMPESFEEQGVQFQFQGFKHPKYPQKNSSGEFVSNLSVLDALFNVGFGGVKDLLLNS